MATDVIVKMTSQDVPLEEVVEGVSKCQVEMNVPFWDMVTMVQLVQALMERILILGLNKGLVLEECSSQKWETQDNVYHQYVIKVKEFYPMVHVLNVKNTQLLAKMGDHVKYQIVEKMKSFTNLLDYVSHAMNTKESQRIERLVIYQFVTLVKLSPKKELVKPVHHSTYQAKMQKNVLHQSVDQEKR